MRLIYLSWKNVLHRPLSTFLSVLLLSFGVGIIILLFSASRQIERQLTRNISGINMVVGAKGSPLQLILSAVYHVDAPTGNIKLKEYQKLLKNPMVEMGIPLSYGDNYQGYRIVGTEKSYPEQYEAVLAQGRWWEKTGEVVIGGRVAELTGLKIGDQFSGSHGLSNDMDQHDHFAYTVVGILKSSGSVMDKLLLTNLKSVWAVHEAEHDHDHDHDHAHEVEREITAALIKFKNPMGNLTVPRIVNQQTSMQAALPAIEVNRLFSLMGSGMDTLRALAVMIVIISGISVFISLFQSLKDRKPELAILRALGGTPFQIAWILIFEGLIVSIGGYILGVALGKTGVLLLSKLVSSNYQYSLEFEVLNPEEAYLLVAVIILGLLASVLPALRAYRMDISKTLADD